MALLLGIDLGTSYFKVGLFEETGALRGLGRVAVEKQSPAPVRVELPVEVFWELLRRALGGALAQAGARPADIAGLSYSSQANTFVLADSSGVPLTPLVFWTDERGGPPADRIGAFSRTEAFRRRVGFGGVTAQSAVTKWRWFEARAPEVWRRARRIMTISDYLTYALTGEALGDAGTAALLGLYDLHAHGWWAEALAAFGVAADRLSAPLPPGSPAGRTAAAAEGLLGVPAGIAFAVGSLDHHVAALGSGLGRLADLSISTGTVLAALALVDEIRPEDGCWHGPHVDGRRYFRLAFDAAGTGQLDDYRRRFAPRQSIEQLIALAAAAPPGGTQADCAGAGPGPAVRRLLERMSLTQRSLVGKTAGGRAVQAIVATGGGARSPVWLQMQADILEVPIVTPHGVERACLGAAAFAAVAAGCHASLGEAVLAMVHPDRTFEPQPRNVAIYRECFGRPARSLR